MLGFEKDGSIIKGNIMAEPLFYNEDDLSPYTYKIYEGFCPIGYITLDFGVVGVNITKDIGYKSFKLLSKIMKKIQKKFSEREL